MVSAELNTVSASSLTGMWMLWRWLLRIWRLPLGIPGRETELTDYSPDGHAERSAIRRQAEAALRLLECGV